MAAVPNAAPPAAPIIAPVPALMLLVPVCLPDVLFLIFCLSELLIVREFTVL